MTFVPDFTNRGYWSGVLGSEGDSTLQQKHEIEQTKTNKRQEQAQNDKLYPQEPKQNEKVSWNKKREQ